MAIFWSSLVSCPDISSLRPNAVFPIPPPSPAPAWYMVCFLCSMNHKECFRKNLRKIRREIIQGKRKSMRNLFQSYSLRLKDISNTYFQRLSYGKKFIGADFKVGLSQKRVNTNWVLIKEVGEHFVVWLCHLVVNTFFLAGKHGEGLDYTYRRGLQRDRRSLRGLLVLRMKRSKPNMEN